MAADLHMLWAMCITCQKVRSKAVISAKMESTVVHKINESIFVDHMGELHKEKGMKYLFMMVDRFSAFVVAELVPDLKLATTDSMVWRHW